MVLKAGYEVDRSKIPDYMSVRNKEMISFYWKYKRFGWPFSGGWAEQPAYIFDVIELLEREMSKTNGR